MHGLLELVIMVERKVYGSGSHVHTHKSERDSWSIVPGSSILGGALWYLSYYPNLDAQGYIDNVEARRIIASAWSRSNWSEAISNTEFWGSL